MCKLNECRVEELKRHIKESQKLNIANLCAMGDLFVKYPKRAPMKIFPTDFSKYPARYQYVFNDHRSKMTVEQYYFCKHKITLNHSHLPCFVVLGGKGHRYYYPIEIVFIDTSLVDLLSELDFE